MPFARFENFEACTLEQKGLGHSDEDAAKICGAIQERAEKGLLYKAQSEGLQVISKAANGDLYVGGYASWDCVDDEGDIITVEAQAKGFARFMALPEAYRNITVNHKEFNLAKAALKCVDSSGTEFFTHTHEKGSFVVSKIRNDSLKMTAYYRGEVEKGNMNGYSITGLPLERDPENPKRITDIEIHSVTLTQKGVMKPINPMSRDVKLLKSKVEKCDCDTDVCGGVCCTFMTVPIPRSDADAQNYLKLHGLECKADGKGGLYVKFPVACKAFDPETKRCTAHESRPDICKAYPITESPFIEKAKCSLLKAKEAAFMKGKCDAVSPSLNDAKKLSVESILKKHGF